MVRPAPVEVPPWADPEDVAFTVSEFQRTGFHVPLNYYRSIPLFFELAGAFNSLTIRQPSFYLVGEVDALNVMRETAEQELRAGLPGLQGSLSCRASAIGRTARPPTRCSGSCATCDGAGCRGRLRDDVGRGLIAEVVIGQDSRDYRPDVWTSRSVPLSPMQAGLSSSEV